MKNQNGRRETEKMAVALAMFGKHFGMGKAPKREILARIVEEGKLSCHLDACGSWKLTDLSVRRVEELVEGDGSRAEAVM